MRLPIMTPLHVEINSEFIGRHQEIDRLLEIIEQTGPKIVVVYGRRRIGKTELLEQSLRDRNILKFEGLENTPTPLQMKFVMRQLADYVNEPLLKEVKITDWVDVLSYIAKYTSEGVWTIYLEELQWMANYQTELVSALKYVWDNFFRRNKKLALVLCGSSPSFMINKVLKSQALYNRSEYTLPLKELTLIETSQMLPTHSQHEILDIYLTVGGMPEYLLRFKNKQSAYITLCKESFLKGAFFAMEPSKIFSSSLGENKYYQAIIQHLSQYKYRTRAEISKSLGVESGGALTNLLENLIECGFIEKYAPYNLATNSNVARYCITDAFLQYYFKFIAPLQKNIYQDDYAKNPVTALNLNIYKQWLGYAFERFCRKYHRVIAAILGFSGIKYRSGAYFSKRFNEDEKGFQIDLLFDRDDKVLTICEIKYLQAPVPPAVINECEMRTLLLPNHRSKTIQRVLISNYGPSENLIKRAYFDRFISINDLFTEHYW